MRNKVKNGVLDGAKYINSKIAIIGDMDTAFQLILLYFAFFKVDMPMPTLALVLGSWFGLVAYIGFVMDVAETGLNRHVGNEVKFSNDDYRKEMIVVMGLTFIEFWTIWEGRLTGEGVVLLVGYIAIQMLISITLMVLKDYLSRLLPEAFVSLKKFVAEQSRKGFERLLELSLKLTSKDTIKKIQNGFDILEAKDFVVEVIVMLGTFFKSCLVTVRSPISLTISMLDTASKATDMAESAHKSLDKENGIEDEKKSILRRVGDYVIDKKYVILIALFRFVSLVSAYNVATFGWDLLGLGIYYIAMFLVADFVIEIPFIVAMWLSTTIILRSPVRKLIKRWARKVDEWIVKGKDNDKNGGSLI